MSIDKELVEELKDNLKWARNLIEEALKYHVPHINEFSSVEDWAALWEVVATAREHLSQALRIVEKLAEQASKTRAEGEKL